MLEIPKPALTACYHIRYLGYNKLTALSPGLFDGLTSLQQL
jgi:hypothetical protein